MATRPNHCHCGRGDAFPETEIDDVTGFRRHFVSCIHCGAEGPRASTEDASIAAWNIETNATAD
jgi:hypothetical protein